ncbi:type IX secretion system membrane protein PorP/SprF [uncultured Polaribacter sp.]|uniref:type IX secretion system membrane protein PorP/SprF n=1 Tax=uncultured Polaribacter sp. TaxID=174711 RepID=UPI002629F31D|nr:type IX secretion system membrane protein PorP/SprF [uncultured Polaribacter sp.]
MKKKYIYTTIVALLLSITISAQEYLYSNQNKLLGTINPSFYGFKESASIGVSYATQKMLNENNFIQNTFAFSSFYFEDYNFSIALDVNQFQISDLGFNATQANLHYIYKTQLSNFWTLNASLSLGYGNNRLDFSSLVFSDQIDVFSGNISGFSIDPVNANNGVSYFDSGVSAHLHNNQNMFFGLSFRHLNKPNISLNEGDKELKDLFMSVQAGYELDLNPINRSFLPENSYLFLYGSFSKQSTKSRISLYQEIVLNNFSFGINQHLNNFKTVNLTTLGTTASIYYNQLELGFNYSFEMDSKKLTGIPYNYFELFVVFDFSKIVRRFDSGNNSRFYTY